MSVDDRFERIDVLTVDWHGNLRGKWIPASQRQKVLDGKVRLPLSTQAQDIWGEDKDQLIGLSLSVGDPDGVCVPTGTKIEIQPWNTSAEQVLTTMYDLDGQPSEFDCRALLSAMVERFTARGWHPVVAVELEFYLLDGSTRFNGKPKVPSQLSIAGEPKALQLYDPRVMQRAEPVLSRIQRYAKAQSIPAETTLSEFGPGQFEINLAHRDDPLQAADDAVRFKRLVDQAALEEDMVASFMAKPYGEHSGSGQHVHVSIVDDEGRNLFDAGDAEPKRLLQAVAGLVGSLEELQLIFAPNGNSYRRLQPDNFAPVRQDWGFDHRGVAVRIPESSGPAARVEHRVAGADANPYLVLLAVLGGILHGLERCLPPASEPLLPGQIPSAPLLTHDWLTAADRLEGSSLGASLLGERFCRTYCAIKRHEAQTLNRQVSDIELETYLSRV